MESTSFSIDIGTEPPMSWRTVSLNSNSIYRIKTSEDTDVTSEVNRVEHSRAASLPFNLDNGVAKNLYQTV